MINLITAEDQLFKDQVETCKFSVALFDHRAHLRLAYVYLVQFKNADESVEHMRVALTNLLKHVGIEPSTKYHNTLTKAWILAVHHFLNKTKHSNSANDFIEQHPEMLNSNIMLTHYSAKLLFSEEARKSFVEPNLEPIPRHRG